MTFLISTKLYHDPLVMICFIVKAFFYLSVVPPLFILFISPQVLPRILIHASGSLSLRGPLCSLQLLYASVTTHFPTYYPSHSIIPILIVFFRLSVLLFLLLRVHDPLSSFFPCLYPPILHYLSFPPLFFLSRIHDPLSFSPSCLLPPILRYLPFPPDLLLLPCSLIIPLTRFFGTWPRRAS